MYRRPNGCSWELLSRGRYDGKEALSHTTVLHRHTRTHRALIMALKWGLISRNPTDATRPAHPQHPGIQTMSEDDLHAFLEVAQETPYYVLFYLALLAGMTRGEIPALTWRDLDSLLC